MQLRKFTLKLSLFSLLCKSTTPIFFTGVYSQLEAWKEMGPQRSPTRGSWKPRIYLGTPLCYRYSHPVIFLRMERSRISYQLFRQTLFPLGQCSQTDVISKGSLKKVYSQRAVYYLKPPCSHYKEYIIFVLVTGL